MDYTTGLGSAAQHLPALPATPPSTRAAVGAAFKRADATTRPAARVARRMHILNVQPPAFKPSHLKAIHRGNKGGRGHAQVSGAAAPHENAQEGGSKLLALTALMATMQPNFDIASLFASILNDFDSESDDAEPAHSDSDAESQSGQDNAPAPNRQRTLEFFFLPPKPSHGPCTAMV